jgi:ribosomal protein S18 acetylase RimI-like enzyme
VNGEPVRIRPYQPADLDDMYRICLLTAANGEDGTALFHDAKLPGHLYVGPYVSFEPSLAFVAEDAAGVAGYTLGALDSRAFEDRLERDWWPALRSDYPEPATDADPSTPEQYAIHNIHHPGRTADELAAGFPSHLHIDLLPRMQRRGIGKKLITTMITALRDGGSPGVHLLVGRGNQRAAGFYRHLGFSEYPATHVNVFTMDLAG